MSASEREVTEGVVCGGGEEGGAEADDDATRTSRRRALPSLLGVPVLQPSAGPRTTSSPPLSPSAACRASLHLPPLRVRLAARRSSPPGARPLPLPLARPSPLLAFDLPHRHGESSRSTYSRPTVYRALRTPKQLSAEIYQSAEVQQCRAEELSRLDAMKLAVRQAEMRDADARNQLHDFPF